MFEKPTEEGYVIGPDMTKGHIVTTVKAPGGFETMVWRCDSTVAPVDEVLNDTWEEALIAHAVMWETCRNLEKRGRAWAFRETPTIPRFDT